MWCSTPLLYSNRSHFPGYIALQVASLGLQDWSLAPNDCAARTSSIARKASFLRFIILDARHPACKASGKVKGKKPPPDYCHEDSEDDSCCTVGKYYDTYKCSPSVSGSTKGVLNIDSFEKGGDGYQPSKCDHKYYSDDTPVVAVSTGWYSGGSRCMKNITISGNGRSAMAMVVDECDSSAGCDADHGYMPPCPNNIVIASRAVWKALGVHNEDWGEMDITWSDS